MTDARPPADAADDRPQPEPAGGDDLARLGEAVQRLAGALRRLDLARLGRAPRQAADSEGAQGAGLSVADLAHGLTERLAELQRVAGEVPAGVRPPRLADHAAGDQLAVVGADAVAAAHARPQAVDPAVVRELADQLRSLRLRL